MSKRIISGITLTLLFIGMLTLAFDIQPVKAEPRTIIVPDDYPTIQEAINVASQGDIIYVKAGTYYENVVVNKSISLIGEDASNTIIDGSGTQTVIWLTAPSSNITGFTIRNGEYGIQVHTSVPYFADPYFTGHRIEGNRILNNFYYGINLRGCANNTVANNHIANNTSFGIYLAKIQYNTIINNTIINNGYGIAFSGNSNSNTLRNNNMTNNEYNFGFIAFGEQDGSVAKDFIYGTLSFYGLVNDVDTSNTVNGKPIYYWVNRHDEQVPSDAGYVWLTDCYNITIKGLNLSHNFQGILLFFTNTTAIVDNSLANNVYGIHVMCSTNTTIIGNNVTDNLNGIYLGPDSRFSALRSNKMSHNRRNFGIENMFLYGSSHQYMNDIDVSNTVDGKPIVYWINQHNRRVPANAGYVALINSTNIIVENLNLSNNFQNMILINTDNTIIANNSITNSLQGIFVGGYVDSTTQRIYNSFNNTIWENTLTHNAVGVQEWEHGGGNSISNNAINENLLGIYTMTYSLVYENTLIKNGLTLSLPVHPDLYPCYILDVYMAYVVFLSSTGRFGGIFILYDHNIIYGNTIRNNSVGVIAPSGYNTFFNNNFIKNIIQTHRLGGSIGNVWDDGYPSGGNYWSDYTGVDFYSGPYQNETGKDGIGDTPYFIDEYNEDNYPLVEPWSPPPPIVGDLNDDGIVDIGDLLTAGKAFGSYPGHPRWDSAADMNNDGAVNIIDLVLIVKKFGKTA